MNKVKTQRTKHIYIYKYLSKLGSMFTSHNGKRKLETETKAKTNLKFVKKFSTILHRKQLMEIKKIVTIVGD